jgi:ferredoxin
MAKIKFLPENKVAEAVGDQKLLVAARKNNIRIRFGCASCRCGTCGVKVGNPAAFHPMGVDESALLLRMRLSTAGDVRLSCQAKLVGTVDTDVDISFQDLYSPDDGDSENDRDIDRDADGVLSDK